jgi:hypothetical protein
VDPGPGTEIFLTLDPGWKNLDLGSGINISDPQYRKKKKYIPCYDVLTFGHYRKIPPPEG